MRFAFPSEMPFLIPLNQENSLPQKVLRRLGIDSLYEKSMKYLQRIHETALDPMAGRDLTEKLHKAVTYLKSIRTLSGDNGSAKQSNR